MRKEGSHENGEGDPADHGSTERWMTEVEK